MLLKITLLGDTFLCVILLLVGFQFIIPVDILIICLLYLTQIWNFLGNIHYQGSFIPELIDNKHFYVITWNMDIHLCLLYKYPFTIYKDDYRAARGFSNCNDSSIFRSSHLEVLLQKGVLEICSKFTREHSCWSVIAPLTFAWVFSCFAAYFKKSFPENTSERLLLYIEL